MKLITFIVILLFMAVGPVHSQWKKFWKNSWSFGKNNFRINGN